MILQKHTNLVRKGRHGLLSLFAAIFVVGVLALSSCSAQTSDSSSNSTSTSTSSSSSNDSSKEQKAPVSALEGYSWSELSAISAEIAATSNEAEALEVAKKHELVGSDGKLDGTQTKSITLSNGKSVQVQIAGFAHDSKTDGGKAGITFIFKDVIAEHAMNSKDTNAGGWKDSQMRSWLASDGMNMLPDDLRSRIVAVDKMTNNTGESKNESSVTKTSDKLWLFSFVELCGGTPKSAFSSETEYAYDIYQAEGSEYKLFKDCNVAGDSVNSILEKSYNGSSNGWWERSPRPLYSENFGSVGDGGRPNNSNSASFSYGVVPGFCI